MDTDFVHNTFITDTDMKFKTVFEGSVSNSVQSTFDLAQQSHQKGAIIIPASWQREARIQNFL